LNAGRLLYLELRRGEAASTDGDRATFESRVLELPLPGK
jgi:hypothetical protein